MTTTDTTARVDDSMRNGVDTATLFATLDAVKQAPEAARFQFRAHNQWVSGTHNRGTIADYFGVGEERTHERTFVFDADHPAVLVGQDHGPTPVEFVLHALAACLTAGLANIAAARKVKLTEVRSTVKGDAPAEKRVGSQTARVAGAASWTSCSPEVAEVVSCRAWRNDQRNDRRSPSADARAPGWSSAGTR